MGNTNLTSDYEFEFNGISRSTTTHFAVHIIHSSYFHPLNIPSCLDFHDNKNIMCLGSVITHIAIHVESVNYVRNMDRKHYAFVQVIPMENRHS